jgi:hypothetical protein
MPVEPGAKVFPIARRSRRALAFPVAVAAFPLLLTLIVAAFVGAGLRPEKVWLEVGQAGIRIAGSEYGRLIEHPETIFVRRLTARDTDYSPKWRTLGIGLPNYHAGWYQLQNGEKALLFVTDWSRTVAVPSGEGYLLIVSPEDPDGFLTALAARKAAREAARWSEPARFPLAPPHEAKSPDMRIVIVAIGASLSLSQTAIMLGLLWSRGGLRLEVSQEGLRIRGPYGRLIPRDAMDLTQARAVDLTQDFSYRGLVRADGINIPGYWVGWFKLGGGDKLLVHLTDRTRAVAIPTNLGYSMLFSPADPAEFLAALRE